MTGKRAERVRCIIAGIVCAWAWPQTAVAAPQNPDAGVRTMRTTFKKIDKDASGSLNLTEVGAAKLDPAKFAKHDYDKNGSLSAEEFTLLYRELLIDSKRSVSRGIQDEVTRICSRRRIREEERRRRERERREAAQRRKNKDGPRK